MVQQDFSQAYLMVLGATIIATMPAVDTGIHLYCTCAECVPCGVCTNEILSADGFLRIKEQTTKWSTLHYGYKRHQSCSSSCGCIGLSRGTIDFFCTSRGMALRRSSASSVPL